MSTVRTANTSPNRKQIQPIKIISKVRVDAHNAPRVFLIGVPEFSNLFFLLTLTTVPATTKNKKKVKKKTKTARLSCYTAHNMPVVKKRRRTRMKKDAQMNKRRLLARPDIIFHVEFIPDGGRIRCRCDGGSSGDGMGEGWSCATARGNKTRFNLRDTCF